MPYATPEQFIQSYGLEETVQLLADEEKLLTVQLLKDALAGSWTGSPTQDEQDAALAAVARFNRKLETQSNMMDGYLRPAVMLPLSPQDANAGTLEECCLALVRCALSDDSDNMTEQMAGCCKDWRAWLRDIANGKVKLAGAGGEVVPQSGGTRTGRTKSNYQWPGHGMGVRRGRA